MTQDAAAAIVKAAHEWRDAVRARQAIAGRGNVLTGTYRIACAEAALLKAVEAMMAAREIDRG